MKSIQIKGTIVNDSTAKFYSWFGIDATSPKSVIDSLPTTNEEVEVIINSGGGDVFAGSEIFTVLKSYKGHVTVKIVGLAASAASVIAMAGDKILISPTAQMMIHNVSTYGSGDYRDFEHISDTLKSANQSIINAYKTKLNKTDEELQKLMDDETWFNANTALEHGFVDEIMFDENKQLSGQFVANFGGIVLNDEIIAKITELMDSDRKKEDKQQNELMQAKLKLLKLRGGNNG
ncbi:MULTISPECIES: head maturation protease, ClpP-related [Bacillus]|uniref:head maturation protease, ClpP-related n=1 Tax=Bacillus TaxID=1386 RepID=UPI0003024D29|nr:MULTISPECIES: head maturation protease, ClpP-related [Bacillus]